MKKQKNRFWLFVFSLCPGAGHMYMGLMRMGLSFLLGFTVLVAVTAITGIDVLSVLPFTLYIYSFFHANNIGGMDAEAFAALEDEYLFGIGEWKISRLQLDRKNRNIAAVVCIVLGICMLWNVGFGMVSDYVGWDNPAIRAVYYTMRDEVPRIVIAIAVIWFGVRLLRGKKSSFLEDDRCVDADQGKKPAALTEQQEEAKADVGSVEEQNPDAEKAEGQCADMRDPQSACEENGRENEREGRE